ncbi:MAG: GatB/YqeY domain-containing protein [Actinomycetota bacterium]|nr:GatB/YqeY domain-containing protein [Actinomycetota bacterium]
MSLKDDIARDTKVSMKGSASNPKEKMRLSTLRLLLAEIKNVEIDKKTSLKDDEIIEVVAKQIKRRKESIEGYKRGGRAEMAAKEAEEMEILTAYMPAQLSAEEIERVISASIEELSAKGDVNMGLVMKDVMAKLKGQADGRLVSELVSSALEKEN